MKTFWQCSSTVSFKLSEVLTTDLWTSVSAQDWEKFEQRRAPAFHSQTHRPPGHHYTRSDCKNPAALIFPPLAAAASVSPSPKTHPATVRPPTTRFSAEQQRESILNSLASARGLLPLDSVPGSDPDTSSTEC